MGDLIAVGELIGGKYQVVGLLGQGGMGAVYLSVNTWTDRQVAIKVLHPEFTSKPEVVQRFLAEAKAATQLAHPNIVDVLDMGQEGPDGTLYIVQEYLTGVDLRRWMDQHGPCSPREALEVLAPIMGALAHAHRRGVVHRDIKPENIFLSQGVEGQTVPKLIDFGISKVLDGGNGLAQTRTGMLMGTPYYMSPEQARGDVGIDARSDVWSIGVVLFEMLAGRCPYEGPNYNILVARILTEHPPRIETLVPDIAPDVAAVVHAALEHDREHRLPGMREFLDAALQTSAFAQGPAGNAGSVPPPGIPRGAPATTPTSTGRAVPPPDTLQPPLAVQQTPAAASPTPLNWTGAEVPTHARSRVAGIAVGAGLFVVTVVVLTALVTVFQRGPSQGVGTLVTPSPMRPTAWASQPPALAAPPAPTPVVLAQPAAPAVAPAVPSAVPTPPAHPAVLNVGQFHVTAQATQGTASVRVPARPTAPALRPAVAAHPASPVVSASRPGAAGSNGTAHPVGVVRPRPGHAEAPILGAD